MQQPKDQILARMYVVLTLCSLLPLLVVLQIGKIYLGEGKTLRAQGHKQANTEVKIPAMRGAILDQAGRTLAVNAARYDLALDPTVAGFSEEAGVFFERLSKLTRRSARGLRRKVERRPSPKYVLLIRGLSEAQKEAVESWDIPGVILDPTFARRYNYGGTAAHLLGHTSADGIGLAGVELKYDEFLQGEDGRRAVQRDRLGIIKAAVGASVVEPKHGETIVLTIDLIRQTILEEELIKGVKETGAKWGTAIALDPHTGAILAMANAPTYDSNRAADYSTAARRNHAITDRLEPGSTFKLVGAVAALEEGVITMEDTVDTGQGWAVFHGRTMRDSHNYGKLTFADVIVMSSNVGMAKTVQKLDPGTFYQYARNFGFGQPTWVDLPGEVTGRLRKPAHWSGTSQTSLGIGYGVDATPLQILAAYCALANNGLLVQPYLVSERRDLTGRTVWTARQDSIRRVFKPETAQKLLPAFERVVEEGTAKKAQVAGLRIAGKTGTARKAVGGGYGSGYRATFVGFFPADDPQVAMIVVMDEPKSSIYGGVASAPVFQRVAERWVATFPKVAERVAPPDTLPPPVRLPETGKSRVIKTAAPDAGTTMPDVTGLSVREAVLKLHTQGVKARVRGRGMVKEQSPKAGATLPAEATIRCE